MKTSSFTTQLMKELMRDVFNLYESDNWDCDRFGVSKRNLRSRTVSAIKSSLLKRRVAIIPKNIEEQFEEVDIIRDVIDGLSWLYDLLDDECSKKTLVKIIAYRILGHENVKLPVNTPDYWEKRNTVNRLIKSNQTINVKFMNWLLNYFDLSEIGIPIKLYLRPSNIIRLFLIEQYKYQRTKTSINAGPGDYVIDAGGCWGDTALYFAHEVGENGKVYTFEFVPANLEVMERNLGLNPQLSQRVEVISNPVWRESNVDVFFHDNGPGTQVGNKKMSEQDDQVSTLSIDSFIRKYEVPKVDFFKMDIEGAELMALEGAKQTIQNQKPKLAIAVYHDLNDLIEIPKFLVSLDLNYKFYLDHFSIHQEETILFGCSQ